MKFSLPTGLLIFIFLLSTISCGTADFSFSPIHTIGDDIVIEGFTNFNADNTVLVEVWPASFGPKGKYESSMTGGGSVMVPVTQGNDSAYKWSAVFESAEWEPGMYMIRAEVIGKDYAETGTFSLSEGIPVDSIGDSELAISNESEKHDIITPVITPLSETNRSENMAPEKPAEPVETQKSGLGFLTTGISVMVTILGYVVVSRQ